MQAKVYPKKRRAPGIEERHGRRCSSRTGGRCDCEPAYRAYVYNRAERKKVKSEAFTGPGARSDAIAWRHERITKQNKGGSITPSRKTLREASYEWLAGTETDPPTSLNRSQLPYKPSAVREYRRNLTNYILPELGAHRLTEIRRGDLQRLIDRLVGRNLSPSKIRNVILSIRVVYRHAIERDEGIESNPTSGLRLPKGPKPRERAADPSEAEALLAVLPVPDRPLWTCAVYAGLRRGELRALRWDDVDLAAGIIRVSRGWDDVEGEIEPKSEKGTRTVPITGHLRDVLTEHKARTGRDGSDFVFGSRTGRPFTPSEIGKRAKKAWETANVERTEQGLEPLVPIGLHECRHTFVSLMFEAGLPLERIGDYVGHSTVYMTDRYRHLLKGHEAEAAKLLDEYLARADTAARLAQV